MARAPKITKFDSSVVPPRLGAVSNLFGGGPDEAATIFDQYNLESVQLLPSFPGLRMATADDVTTAVAEQMSRPFVDLKIQIAAVSASANFLDTDRRRRKRFVKRFDAVVEHCHAFGTRFVVTETGTLNPDHPWDDFPDNHTEEAFRAFVAALTPSVRLAEKNDVVVLLEGHVNQVIGSAEQAKMLREELGEHVGFVMDPPNFMSRSMISSSKKHLREMFKTIGPFAPVAHGKDIRLSGTDLVTPRAGTGSLDYHEFLAQLNAFQPGCPLILEQLRPEELRETVDFIDRFFE